MPDPDDIFTQPECAVCTQPALMHFNGTWACPEHLDIAFMLALANFQITEEERAAAEVPE